MKFVENEASDINAAIISAHFNVKPQKNPDDDDEVDQWSFNMSFLGRLLETKKTLFYVKESGGFVNLVIYNEQPQQERDPDPDYDGGGRSAKPSITKSDCAKWAKNKGVNPKTGRALDKTFQ